MKNICLPLIASGEKTLSVAMTWMDLVKASHNLGCEIFFLIQMNPVWSVELICLDIFFKKCCFY